MKLSAGEIEAIIEWAERMPVGNTCSIATSAVLSLASEVEELREEIERLGLSSDSDFNEASSLTDRLAVQLRDTRQALTAARIEGERLGMDGRQNGMTSRR